MRTIEWGPTHRVQERTGPSVSMALFWIFLALAIVILLDPLNPGLATEAGYLRLPRDTGPVKYTALMFGMLGLGFSLVGMSLFSPERWRLFTASLKSSWPILMCALLVLAGSLYARLILGIKESYLSAGLAMLAFPIGLAMIMDARNPVKMVHAYFVALTLASVYMTAQIIIYRRTGGQAFHEEIFLLVPLALYWFLVHQKKWYAWLWVIVIAAVGIHSYKNTSFLVLILVMGYLFWLLFRDKLGRLQGDGLRRIILGYGIALTVLAVVAGLLYFVLNYRQELPSGNTGVRTFVYRVVWEKFLSSPIYGTLFTGNTNIYFPFFPVVGEYRVVTHSDFLDFLGQSGVLGFALFLGALYTPFRLSSGLKLTDARLSACVHGLRAVALSGIIVMLFNPLLMNMPIGTMYWVNAAFLTGLGCIYRVKPAAADGRQAYMRHGGVSWR